MRYFFMDASAWAKYYVPERGTDVVVHLMDALPLPKRLVVISTAIAETVAVLNRKRNLGIMSETTYARAVDLITTTADHCIRCRVYDNDPVDAITFISRHNINSSDALVLYKALQFRAQLRRSKMGDLVLVASDKRFLRAAAAEGLTTLDPEAASVEDVTALLQ